jgi:hypothetical protein
MKMCVKFMERLGEEAFERDQHLDALLIEKKLQNQLLEEMRLREIEQLRLLEELKQSKQKVIIRPRVKSR